MTGSVKRLHVRQAELDWLPSGLPWSREFDDVYFSREDARGESKHVFLDAQDLEARWREQAVATPSPAFLIGELGFGCGLNFLQTWQRWQVARERGEAGPLHYLAFESTPLRVADLRRVFSQWPELLSLGERLLAHYPAPGVGCQRLHLEPGLCLDLFLGDALDQLRALPPWPGTSVQNWFADGFSPKQNPALWQESLFQTLAARSAPGALLSTYSVAGSVRRSLQAAGFSLERLPGFGRKREMLRARLDSPRETKDLDSDHGSDGDSQPWFRLPVTATRERRALIIGAGLAGCSTAHALARRGWRVRLLEAGTAFSGASGIPQLALRPRLIADDSPVARFYLQAYLYSARLMNRLPREAGWHASGVLQLDDAINRNREQVAEKLQKIYGKNILQRVNTEQQRQLAHTELNADNGDGGAWYFPQGGWVESTRLRAALLNAPDIELSEGIHCTSLRRESGQWLALDADGTAVGNAEVLVLAIGPHTSGIEQCRGLPLTALRGQSSGLQATAESRGLATVVCGQRSVFPALNGVHSLSASYEQSELLRPRAADDSENLARARSLFAAADFLGETLTGSSLGLRASTPDRVPLLGPLPDLEAMSEQYAALRRDASTRFDEPGRYYQGLYINGGHGSNGLATAPFCGEALASLIAAEPLPLDREVLALLNPARFLIRDLKRQKQG